MENHCKITSETLNWVNANDGARFYAGVAYYQPKFGEYKLILDGPKTVLYLRATEACEDRVSYKVYAPIFKRGRYSHRSVIGHGYRNANTDGHIYLTIGRYYPNRLTLISQKEEQL